MSAKIQEFHRSLMSRAAGYGIEVGNQLLDGEVPGVFDGPTITLNEQYDAVERAFYLAHSIGSIAEWSLRHEESQQIFRELQQAKKSRSAFESRFERALAGYLAFENITWEFAVWLLEYLGHRELVPSFTNFGRADLESMRIFHSTGKAPVWQDFFKAWNEEVARGARAVAPFAARPIPAFRALRIPKQEIVQEEDGQS